MEGGKAPPPETPMLVEMGKSGTPALLLCELLRPALVQRLDLLSPMHARAGQIMLARKKRKEKKSDVNKTGGPAPDIGGTVLFFLFFFFFPPSFFLDQPCADGRCSRYCSLGITVDFFMFPPGPARSQEGNSCTSLIVFVLFKSLNLFAKFNTGKS